MADSPPTVPAVPHGEILRRFLDSGPVMAFIRREDGRFVYVNPAMAEFVGVPPADVHEDAGSEAPALFAKLVRTLAPQTLADAASESIAAIPRADGAVDHWKLARFPFTGPDLVRYVGGVAVNVTDLREAQARLTESERRYRLLVESGHGLICTHDMEGRLLTVNQAALDLTGANASDVIGHYMGDLLSEASREAFPAYLKRMDEIGTDSGLMFVRAANGRELAWKYRNVKVEETGRAPYVLGHAQDVTELRDVQEQLRELAMTDDLTGLQNRRSFFVNGTRFLVEGLRTGKAGALFYFDIERLKDVNDTHGHDAGSALIVSAATVLKNSFRAADVLARIGGDEFVALASVPPDDVATILKRLQWHLDRFNAESGLSYALGITVGVANFELTGGVTLEQLLQEADAAMYRQKRVDVSGEAP